MIRYVDTSAALKLLVEEPESAALAETLDAAATAGDRLVASMLVFTDLHCAARRPGGRGVRGTGIPVSSVTTVVDGLILVDVERSDLVRAATSEWGLRSADSIHLAAALRIEADAIVTYDIELAAAAARAGLQVQAPGVT